MTKPEGTDNSKAGGAGMTPEEEEQFIRQQRGYVLRCQRMGAGGLTQQELAGVLKVPVEQVQAWETGEPPHPLVLAWFEAAACLREETSVKAAVSTRGAFPGLGGCVVMRRDPERIFSEQWGSFSIPLAAKQAGIGKVLAMQTVSNSMAKKPVMFPRGVPFWVAPADDMDLLRDGIVGADVWEGTDRPSTDEGFTLQCWRRGLGMTTGEVAAMAGITSEAVEQVEASVTLPESEGKAVVDALADASTACFVIWQQMETFAQQHRMMPAATPYESNQDLWAEIADGVETADGPVPPIPLSLEQVARAWVVHGLRVGGDWVAVTKEGQLAVNGRVMGEGEAPAGVDFRHLNLEGANLTQLDLIEPCFQGMNLRCANFAGARITGADFTGADLTGANLTGTDLRDSDLTDANLTGANLTNAHSSKSITKGIILDDAITTGWRR